MKTLSTLVAVLLIALNGFAQYTSLVVNSQQVPKSVSKIATDTSGNVILSGTFGNTITFGSYSLTYNSGPYSSPAAFVAKMSAANTVQWAAAFKPADPTGGIVEIKGLATDKSGNVYATGTFQGKIAFIGTTLTSDKIGSTYNWDMFTAKISASGSLQWVKADKGLADGCNATETGFSVICDNSGNVYSAGQLVRQVFNNSSSCSSICQGATSKSVTCISLNKYSSSGAKLYSKLFFNSQATSGPGCGRNTRGGCIQTDGTNIYLSGEVTGSVNIGGITLNTGGETVRNSFLAKLDPTGTAVWVKSFTGGDNLTYWLGEGQCFLDDNLSDVYMSGILYGPNSFSFGTCSVTATASRAYLAKASATTGNCDWVIHPGGIVYGIMDYPDGSLAMLIRTDQNGQPATYAIKRISKTDGSTIDSIPTVMTAPTPYLRFWSGLAKTPDGFVFCQNLQGSYSLDGITVSSVTPLSSSYQDIMLLRYTQPANSNQRLVRNTASSELVLYPNPAGDQITIRNAANEPIGAFTICDISGRVMLNETFHSAQTSIDLTAFPSGMYYFRSAHSAIRFMKQ